MIVREHDAVYSTDESLPTKYDDVGAHFNWFSARTDIHACVCLCKWSNLYYYWSKMYKNNYSFLKETKSMINS